MPGRSTRDLDRKPSVVSITSTVDSPRRTPPCVRSYTAPDGGSPASPAGCAPAAPPATSTAAMTVLKVLLKPSSAFSGLGPAGACPPTCPAPGPLGGQRGLGVSSQRRHVAAEDRSHPRPVRLLCPDRRMPID